MTFQLRPIFLVLMAIAVFSPCRAYGQVNYTVEPTIGRLYGYTLYNISGYGYVDKDEFFCNEGFAEWESELEWPINNTIAGLKLGISDHRNLNIDISLRKNIDAGSGKMKDSDLINYDNISIPDMHVYSESDTDSDIYEFIVNGTLLSFREKYYWIHLTGSFKYQHLSFTAGNVVQNDTCGNHYENKGLVGTYDVDYYIPSIGVDFRSFEDRKTTWDISANIGYVTVKDIDDHVLRFKESRGKSTGISFTLAGETRHDISKRAFISLGGEFTYIYAEGKQKQVWYETTDEAVEGTTYTGIPLEIESSQAMINLGIGFRF